MKKAALWSGVFALKHSVKSSTTANSDYTSIIIQITFFCTEFMNHAVVLDGDPLQFFFLVALHRRRILAASFLATLWLLCAEAILGITWEIGWIQLAPTTA